ncbi:uncharacterized protein LOC116126340 [Pistacia vera]|uniref:uncharacterized protein LOC116126340 n=1 Tax=Pistacia vera TaxID=55513 RepID=UPI001262EE83|nr:uncharacterized protein LOC116126340 [Pistacia vera]
MLVPTAHTNTITNCHPMLTRSKTRNNQITSQAYLATTSILYEPKSVSEALTTSEWRQAMNEDFESLKRNNTWELVPPTSDVNIVGCKWVFKTKLKSDGTLQKYKARLVAKGFQQTPGVDYFDTILPVIKPTTIKIMFSLAVHNSWQIQQIDINNAFLNGDLTETVS